ncbi:MAG: hypothetical protein AABX52_00860 [Nanoarchaeota archaeon]
MHKKGFEIAVTMLVVLILSIVIFAGGLYLIREYFILAKEVQAQVDADTARQINAKLLEGIEKVIIPIHKKRATGGQVVTFGMGVLNTLGNENTFGMDVSFVNAYDKDTEQLIEEAGQDYINKNWIIQEYPDFLLEANARKVIPISVRVDNKMSEEVTTRRGGIYVFNVCVYKDPLKQINCGAERFIQPDLDVLHGNKVIKMYVQTD